MVRLPNFGILVADCAATLQPAFEFAATLSGFFHGIQSLHQAKKALLQFGNAHVPWSDIDVEERTQFPCPLADKAALALQALVERGAGKWRQKGDLHFVQA